MIENPAIFYIVRHGETDWNSQHLAQGHANIPLNVNGEKQAEELSDSLKDIHFDAIFSSDLLRAYRTAEILAAGRETAVQATEMLREGDVGDFERTNATDFFRTFADWEQMSLENRAKHHRVKELETVESVDSMVGRLTNFLKGSALSLRGKSALIVSHGAIIAHFMSTLGYGPRHKVWIDNGALVVVESDGKEVEIRKADGVRVVE